LVNRVALVTGCGKRDGMGRAIATTLAASGAAVVVTDRQPAGVPNRRQEVLGITDEGWRGVDSLTDEITAAGGQAISVLGDVAAEADARRIVEAAAAWQGRLDILVNVAAAPQGLDRTDVEQVPIELFDLQIAVAVRGTFLMSRFAVPHMRVSRWGRIINISSMAGVVAAPWSTAYSAAKAGVLGLTRAMSADVAPWGITVNAIAPGMVATSRAILSMDPDIDYDAEIKARGSSLAVGRSGYPEDIAAAVAYLASDGSAFMTGQTLQLDGGGRAAPFVARPPSALPPGEGELCRRGQLRRFALITWAACCGPRGCWPPAGTPRPGRSAPASCAPPKTRRSARSSRSSGTWACAR
jgi:3-oxoacyl-[acyl-carrier protein] reductase